MSNRKRLLPAPIVFRMPGIIQKNSTKLCILRILIALYMMFFVKAFAYGIDENTTYQYKDTRRLVRLVDDAAVLLKENGETAFEDFAIRGSDWFYGQYYLFVFNPDGVCLFHPVRPEFVGKNMMNFRDINNKPVVELITRIGEQSASTDRGWVFYEWPEKEELMPQWKSAYIRRVVDSKKRAYLIGSGAYNLKTERTIVEKRVRMAANLLVTKGKDYAFDQFRNRATPYSFLDAYIFVIDMEGRTVFDPAYPTLDGRSVTKFRDVNGNYPIKELLQKLTDNDEAQLQYFWRRLGEFNTSRKSMYARKIKVGEETLIVGSSYFLATPIWMR